MKVKFNVQQKGVNTLKEKLESHSNSSLKKVYMLIGNMKDTGFEIIEEFLIDLKARKYFMVGIDKKTTTRRMLEELCKQTKNVYVYNNNYEDQLDASVFVFEYTDLAVIYTTCGSTSSSSFVTDTACFTEVEYDLKNAEDVLSYKEFVAGMVELSKSEEFIKIDKLYVAKLVDEKEIFSTKQYTHNVLSISELLNKNGVQKPVSNVDLEEAPKTMPKIDLNKIEDFTLDIDIGEVAISNEEDEPNKAHEDISFAKLEEKEIAEDKLIEITKEDKIEDDEEYEISDEVIDMESMLFEKADIKLNKKNKEEKEDKNKSNSRKVDLEKVSNLFLELPSKDKNGNQIKVPCYIKDMIENFFEGLSKEKLYLNENGINERKQKISLEIIDVNDDKKYKDIQASIVEQMGKTYISFNSEEFQNIYYEEKDLARIIKLAHDTYHIEIIPKTTDEYSVWKKLCTTSLRGTNRCYGVM